MNKSRRLTCEQVRIALQELKWQVDSLKVDEEEAFENRPANLKTEAAENVVYALEEAADYMAEAINALEEAVA